MATCSWGSRSFSLTLTLARPSEMLVPLQLDLGACSAVVFEQHVLL